MQHCTIFLCHLYININLLCFDWHNFFVGVLGVLVVIFLYRDGLLEVERLVFGVMYLVVSSNKYEDLRLCQLSVTSKRY